MPHPVYYDPQRLPYRPGEILHRRADGAVFCRAAGDPALALLLFAPGAAHDGSIFHSAHRLRLPAQAAPPLQFALKAEAAEPARADILLLYDPLRAGEALRTPPCGCLVPADPLLAAGVPLTQRIADEALAPAQRLALARGLVRIFAKMALLGRCVGAAPLESFLAGEDGALLFAGFDQACPDTAKTAAAGVRGWAACLPPDALLAGPTARFSEESERFYLAVLLFRVLTGLHPFAPEPGPPDTYAERVAANICDGRSVFFDEDAPAARRALARLAQYPPALTAAFRRAFDYCGRSAYQEGLPGVDEWFGELLGQGRGEAAG